MAETSDSPQPGVVRDWRGTRPTPTDIDRLVEEAGLLRRAGCLLGVALDPQRRERDDPELADAEACGDLVVVDTLPRDTLLLPREQVADTVDVARWSGGGEPSGPPVVAVMPPAGGGWRATWRALARLADAGVLLEVWCPAGCGLRPLPRLWRRHATLRALRAATGAVHLQAADLVVDLGSGGPIWAARARAAGAVVLDAREGVDVRALRPVLDRARDRTGRAREAARQTEAARHESGVSELLRSAGISPSRTPGPTAATRRHTPRALLVSSNGAGMGHLTRLVAMADRAEGGAEVHVLSMSQAVGIAVGDRYPIEYVPSAGDLGIGSRRWNTVFTRRLAEAAGRLRPAVLVFDGAYPYQGVVAARAANPATQLVWSRRAMWKPGMGVAQLARSGDFDLVIEPGEVAREADRGLTTGRKDAVRVRPVVLLDDADLLDRATARRHLGLDAAAPAALVTLGAGNLADISSDLGAVVAALLQVPDLQLCVTRPPIAGSAPVPDPRVTLVSRYPVTRYVRAFDLSVSTAGYNSFHESVAFGLPTAFVANTTQLDDQEARARWADQRGLGVHVQPQSPASLSRAVDLLADPSWRAEAASACRAAWPGNGAGDAMAAVLRLAEPGETRSAGTQPEARSARS